MKEYSKLIFILCFALSISFITQAEFRVNNIFITRHNVFDPNGKDWFFAAGLANSLHIVTHEYIIRDELLFREGDIIDFDILNETEKNLRDMNIFSKVEILLDSINEFNYDIYIETYDRWSTNPALLFGSGGDAYRLGFRIEELNFFGTATVIVPELLYRTENETRWQGELSIRNKRLFRLPLSFEYDLFINRFRTLHNFTLSKPYYSRFTKNSYGIRVVNNFGNDLLFLPSIGYEQMNFGEKGASLWYSHSWLSEDKLFVTALFDFRKIDRGEEKYIRAFDNTARLLVAFSSISQNFYKLSKINSIVDEDIVVGGWGTAILGRLFAIDSTGTNAFYLAGIGEKSYLSPNNKFYAFGSLMGGSAFSNSIGFNTYQEFFGLAFYRIHQDLLAALQIRQQTVWNWKHIRQLLLDNEHYLRGYKLNQLTGDNRLVTNFEIRYFTPLKFWIFSFSPVLFYDGGMVWQQNKKIFKNKWRNSAGLGIRILNEKTAGKLGVVRIDFAFNFEQKKFAEIIISSEQFFSAFKSHQYRLPKILGEEFEYE